MLKRRICLLALPLLSIAACLDTSDQDSADGTSFQALGVPPAASICESHGSFCVGAPSLAFEGRVLETASGRNFEFVSTATGINLAFSADPTRCAALADTSPLVEVRACTVEGASWSIQTGPDGHSCVFKNRLGGFLSGFDDGSQFQVLDASATHAGWRQQFTVPGRCG
jgi:hypothetical protein